MKLKKPFTCQEYLDFYTYAQLNHYIIVEKDTCFELVKQKEKILSHEEIRKKRFDLYVQYVDPITAQIQRLKDEILTDEIQEKILKLQKERSSKINEIKTKCPYNNLE